MIKKIKLGVLGVSGHFTKRIFQPISKSSKIEVYAIASRSNNRAKEFAQEHNIQKYYNSYEKLLEDKTVEAVYIPLPNHMHLEWIKKAIDFGKHIICEKPLTIDSEETMEVISYLKDKKIILMEAFMYKFHPKWIKAKELIKFGEIGKVTYIHTVFSYNNNDAKNIRNIKKYGGGALMDIGCYAISSARYILGKEPKKVVSLIKEHEEFSTDKTTSAILDFGEERCLFSASTDSYPQQEVRIYGTDGVINVTIPFNDYNDVCGEIIVENKIGKRSIKFNPVNQYKLQFEYFVGLLKGNKNKIMPVGDSLMNMKVIDAVFESEKTGNWVIL